MKKSFFSGAGIGALSLLLLWSVACKKASAPAPNDITPLQRLLNTDTSITYFHLLVLSANENDLLADDSITMLIPTNDAFRAAGYLTDSVLGQAESGRLVRYHVLKGRVTPDIDSYLPYNTVAGYSIYGTKDPSRGILFNAIPVSGDPIPTGRALVYKLTAPLTPPADSVQALLAADSTLSFFNEALIRTGLDTIIQAGTYTLLAPVNSAFMAIGYDSLGAIDSADIPTLTGLVQDHMLFGVWFSNALERSGTVPTYSGRTITINRSGSILQFTINGSSNPANLIIGDLPAASGFLVHKIDRVLQ